jgi:hypothetical protein
MLISKRSHVLKAGDLILWFNIALFVVVKRAAMR